MAATKKHVLFVEDEYFLAETLKIRLENSGYNVDICGNGAEALTWLSSNRADVVIMDAMMPVMDGFEATQKIKADPKLKKIPVIFLTALARPSDKEQALAAGGDDYMTKPFDSSALISLLEKWVGK